MGLQAPVQKKDKVVFVMGATGTGKSKLSIDLAIRFSGEIVNSDKMQVYRGLDVVTNKVTDNEMRGVPHHLLGILDPEADFTAWDFCRMVTETIDSIVSRGNLPIVAGGSNSFIEALVDGKEVDFRATHDCCFLWVDVAAPVLHPFLGERVDKMVEKGLVEEVRMIFDREADADCYARGIRRAIGVPEMDGYLRAEDRYRRGQEDGVDEEVLARLLHGAIDEIKANTCKLACCQLEKINRLRSLSGWPIHRVVATEVFQRLGREAEEAWERLVAAPTMKLVEKFLLEKEEIDIAFTTLAKTTTTTTTATAIIAAPISAGAVSVTLYGGGPRRRVLNHSYAHEGIPTSQSSQ